MRERERARGPEAEPDGAQERELRALLERAVPQPPAPAQRLERVRERLRRRRRRRTAAVTGGAVLAVAAGLLAVPGLVRPQGGQSAAPPAGVRGTSGVPDRTAGPAPKVPTTTPAAGGYRPSGMGGLELRLPGGWKTLQDQATGSVFASRQSLTLPEGGCDHALDGFCTPLARALAGGGVLVMFREQKSMQAGKLHDLELPVEEQEPYRSCRTVGGTRQLTRTLTGGSGLVVWAVACLAEPTQAQVTAVRELLSSAAFT